MTFETDSKGNYDEVSVASALNQFVGTQALVGRRIS
jgi:hypothetical protein